MGSTSPPAAVASHVVASETTSARGPLRKLVQSRLFRSRSGESRTLDSGKAGRGRRTSCACMVVRSSLATEPWPASHPRLRPPLPPLLLLRGRASASPFFAVHCFSHNGHCWPFGDDG